MIIIDPNVAVVETVQDGCVKVQVLAIETTYELKGERYTTLTKEPFGVRVIDRQTVAFLIPEYDLYQYERADVSDFAKPRPAVLTSKNN